MQEYFNKCCSQCGEKFTEDDNIAVCPDCGTPIHRSCWNGHCPNEARHAEGFDWNKAEAAEVYKKMADIGAPSKNVCALCHEPSDDDMVYCPDCGAAMHKACYKEKGACPNEANHGKHFSEHEFPRSEGFEESGFIKVQSFSEMMQTLKSKPVIDKATGEELTCYGIHQKELISFLGENYLSTPRYLMMFLRMANTNKRVSLNIFAGLLMPYYQFYQRMIGPGIILLILNFILSLPSSVYQINLMMNNGAESNIALSGAGSVITLLSFIGVAVQVLVALFNDYFYMRWSVNKIHALREKCRGYSEQEYHEALSKAGAPKWRYTLIGIGIALVLSGLFTLLYF